MFSIDRWERRLVCRFAACVTVATALAVASIGCAASKQFVLGRSSSEPGERAIGHKLMHKKDDVCLVRKSPEESKNDARKGR